MAILNRNRHLTETLVAAATSAWLARKLKVLVSGSLEEDLSRVTSAKIGSLKDPHFTVEKLLQRFRSYKSSFYWNVFSFRDSTTLARVNAAIDNLESDVSDGTLRKQPFCVLLYGYPGTGKSSFAIQIARALMKDRHGDFKSTDMVTLNETDEYQSEFRTSHKVVLFDDIGASKYGLADTKNPWRKVIDFVNNIKKTALNPNVEMKGKVYIEPELVILTSNLNFQKGGLINAYIPAFEAILRRISSILQVMDHTNVQVLERTNETSQDEGGSYLCHRHEYAFRGGPFTPQSFTREAIIDELRVLFSEHMEDQARFIDRFNAYFDDVCDNSLALPEGAKPVLVSQSGVKIGRSVEDHKAASIQFYLKRVDWERYFVECYSPLSMLSGPSYLDGNGVVHYFELNRGDHEINKEAFNEAYELVRAPSGDPGDDIKAESKVVESTKPDIVYVSGQDDPPEDPYLLAGEKLREMGRYWDQSNQDWQPYKLPCPFGAHFAPPSAKPRVWRRRFTQAWVAYIAYSTGLDVDQIMGHPAVKHFPFIRNYRNKKRRKVLQAAVDRLLALADTISASDSSSEEEDERESSSITPSITSNDQLEHPPSYSTSGSYVTWGNEKTQISHVISVVNPQNSKTYINSQLHSFGEIDLVIKGSDTILVFECKKTPKRQIKARAQAIRYACVMRALYPEHRVIGLTHSFIGFTVVCDTGDDGPCNFGTFLKKINYIDPPEVLKI